MNNENEVNFDEKEESFIFDDKDNLIPEGEMIFTVTNGVQQTSKSGNDMFKWTLFSDEYDKQLDVYTLTQSGKRWLFKQLFSVCGIEKSKEGKYKFKYEDIIDKKVIGKVKHDKNIFTTTNGNEIEQIKESVVAFKKLEE